MTSMDIKKDEIYVFISDEQKRKEVEEILYKHNERIPSNHISLGFNYLIFPRIKWTYAPKAYLELYKDLTMVQVSISELNSILEKQSTKTSKP